MADEPLSEVDGIPIHLVTESYGGRTFQVLRPIADGVDTVDEAKGVQNDD